MEVNRIWEMPHKWTFRMKCVQGLFLKYSVGQGWADPFAGSSSIAEYTNDIEDRGAGSQLDALEFLTGLETESMKGILFDPPYSVEQCLRRYTPKHKGTAGRAEYWARCKDQIARIVKPSGIAICFAWDSTGIGKTRDFQLNEVLLICHGACHNDTIVTVESKPW